MKIQILRHPGAKGKKAKDDTGKEFEHSAVQTSDGDKFYGDTADLPEAEAKLLIAANRAVEVKPTVTASK